ncbi:hypothetical protein COT40_01300 [Candidatus Peregrinibacteria bacterium CG08_land_8_20_14_0_20_41_10]|nr:MAG: hypothetical protein AUJ78_00495 [Candidatus Peregrinibacteria bacterium CG1_02_41_10]PIS32193.1 MAG: hypothetical protein COT40_01300 [Candidatus Peregrinibacteria bacterium CG08_land_8_20_14_0_20_41_10]
MTTSQLLSKIGFEKSTKNLLNVRDLQRNSSQIKLKLDKTREIYFVTNRNKIDYAIMSPELLKTIITVLKDQEYSEMLEKAISRQKDEKFIPAKTVWKNLGV